MVGTIKISFTSLSTLDTNSFRDAFNNKIIFIASFIPACFSSPIFLKVLIWVYNLNLSRSLLKCKDIAKIQDQNLFHAKFLKTVFYCRKSFKVIFLLNKNFWR